MFQTATLIVTGSCLALLGASACPSASSTEGMSDEQPMVFSGPFPPDRRTLHDGEDKFVRRRALPVRATWVMYWDHDVNHKVTDHSNHCALTMRVINDHVTASFTEGSCGGPENSMFVGEFTPSETAPLLWLRQDDPGYTCSYQAMMTPTGELHGVWHDTRGRAGDFTLVNEDWLIRD